MPSEETIKTYMYHRLQKNSKYPTWDQTRYFCNKASYTSKCSSGQTEYICYLGKDNLTVVQDNIQNSTQVLTFCDGFYKGAYSKYGSPVVDSNGYGNIVFTNQGSTALVRKDLLLETDYYQRQRDEELKTLLQDNSSSSDSSVSVDMTSTNNILYTIALILCVILILSFLRRLFNRSVH